MEGLTKLVNHLVRWRAELMFGELEVHGRIASSNGEHAGGVIAEVCHRGVIDIPVPCQSDLKEKQNTNWAVPWGGGALAHAGIMRASTGRPVPVDDAVSTQ